MKFTLPKINLNSVNNCFDFYSPIQSKFHQILHFEIAPAKRKRIKRKNFASFPCFAFGEAGSPLTILLFFFFNGQGARLFCTHDPLYCRLGNYLLGCFPLLQFIALEGLNSGVPTRTTPTLTPTTLRSIEQTFIELQSKSESHENEAGFVPPLVHSIGEFAEIAEKKTSGI